MEEFLSLKWKNHSSTFLKVLDHIRKDQTYSDVTLTCSGKFYSVHKFVLTACSDYFKEIFNHTEGQKPVVIINGISCEDLEVLLNYMYLGEVNVKQSDITSLIKSAEYLQIKGLAVADEEPAAKRKSSVRRLPIPPAKNKRIFSEVHSSSPSPKHFKPVTKLHSSENINSIPINKIEEMDDNNHIFIKEEFTSESEEESGFAKQNSNMQDDSKNFHDFSAQPPMSESQDIYLEKRHLEINSIFQGDSSEWPSGSDTNDPPLDQHSETNLLNHPNKINLFVTHQELLRPESRCNVCFKQFNSGADLKRHMMIHTGEKGFFCPHCCYKANRKGNVQAHITRMHSEKELN